MNPTKVHLTPAGKLALEQELKELIAERPAIAEKIAIARGFGDLKENEEYSNARAEQKISETRILDIEEILKNAVIINTSSSDKVTLGCTVTVEAKGKKLDYTIVGPVEADPLNGKISNESPIGKLLIGAKVGEEKELITPKSTTTYKIIAIK